MAHGARERLGATSASRSPASPGRAAARRRSPSGSSTSTRSARTGRRRVRTRASPATATRSAAGRRSAVAPPRAALLAQSRHSSRVSWPASVGGDERLRLFLALELPPERVAALAAWAQRHASRPGSPPRRNLHVTLAFLGSRPAAELDADRRRPARRRPPRARRSRSRPRATARRAASGCSCSPTSGRARRGSPAGCTSELEALGVYEREARPWLPHVTVRPLPRAAAAPAAAARRSGRSVRPTPLLSFPSAPDRGASTERASASVFGWRRCSK